jgi:hypothetical protein
MMKLSKLFMIALLVGTMGVIGCGDETTGTGGMTGTGGTGGTGGFDFDTACDRGLCLQSDVLKAECETLVAACRTEPPANQDECIIVITEKCDGG